MHDLVRRAIETDDPISELVAAFYGPDGPLVEKGWEVRPQQLEMSMDIALTMDAEPGAAGNQWSIHEAPCGTGKGLAYLVPGLLNSVRAHRSHTKATAAYRAAEASAKKAGTEVTETRPPDDPPKMIVSTANIALQEQLINKDIPALSDMLDYDFRAFLMKGRNNYVCREKMMTAAGTVYREDKAVIAQLAGWMEEDGCTGDKESLTWDPGKAWRHASVMSDECSGRGCAFYNDDEKPCFWRSAIQGSGRAHVLVVNHHFLVMNRSMHGSFLAVDEMHELEGSLRSAFTERMTAGAGKAIGDRVAKLLGEEEGEAVAYCVARVMGAAEDRYNKANRGQRWTSPTVFKPGWMGDEAPSIYADMIPVRNGLAAMVAQVGGYVLDGDVALPPRRKGLSDEDADRANRVVRTYNQMVGIMKRVYTAAHAEPHPKYPSGPWAVYADSYRDKVTVHMSPGDVSQHAIALAHRYPVTCLTSATVPDFKSLYLTLGMSEGEEGIALPRFSKRMPSPFPLEDMGAIVVPNGPSPKDRTWRVWAAREVVRVVEAAQGRTLVLCSSIAQMRAYGAAIRSAGLPYPVKVQGEEGRGQLRRWFKDTTAGVLVGSRSFFQGLDVQGESLSVVVIDRIPFARPDDPVEEVVGQILVDRAGGGNAFMLRSVPEASMVLAQGAGRLIRSMADRGAIVVLDNRLSKAGPAWRALRKAMPPFPMGRSADDVRKVLNNEPLDKAPRPRAPATSNINF